MKLSNVKAMFGKVMAAGLVAGAVALLAPAKAEAQRIGVGVQFGAPVYQGYGGYGYHGRDAYARQLQWERHEAWVRHEEWVRAHEYRHLGYGPRPYSYGR